MAAAENQNPDHYRVMVVDDSVVIRGTVRRFLDAQPGIRVVSYHPNGEEAVKAATSGPPVDVIVLDIQMPVMDGITALPLLLKAQPEVKVLISSTLTQRNADISIDCLQKGAADYIPKPESAATGGGGGPVLEEFFQDMHHKVLALGAAARQSRKLPPLQITPAATPVGAPSAQHIIRQTGVAVFEAANGDVAEGRKLYVAPGGYHMLAERKGLETVLRLDQSPPENFCRPAVAGVCSAVLPLEQIGPEVLRLAGR